MVAKVFNKVYKPLPGLCGIVLFLCLKSENKGVLSWLWYSSEEVRGRPVILDYFCLTRALMCADSPR